MNSRIKGSAGSQDYTIIEQPPFYHGSWSMLVEVMKM